ncbi:MAG: peptidoglycan-binding domain-containing protein, partial [Myxococcota bacterium]
MPTSAPGADLDVDGLLARHLRRDADPSVRTERLRTFQRERGLPETGRLDAETRVALGRLVEAEAYRSRWVADSGDAPRGDAPRAVSAATLRTSADQALAPPSRERVAPPGSLVPGVIDSLSQATPAQRAALARIGVQSDAAFRRLGPITLNARITAEYARLYAEQPELFKWAGMAAYTSAVVGRGLEIAGREVPASAALRGVAAVSPRTGDAVAAASARFVQMLRTGNAAVYLDIAWQHAAFLEGGIDAIREAGLPALVQ